MNCNIRKVMSKAIVFFVVVIFAVSCGKDEVYSCDPEADMWVKSNLVEIKEMTRAEWLAIDDYDFQRAAYIAFNPKQKQDLWIGKMEEVLTLEWSVQEREHIQSALKLLKANLFAFSKERDQKAFDKLEVDLYKWEEFARTELGWDKELLYDLVYTAQAMNVDKKVNTELPAKSKRLKNRSESGLPESRVCSCNFNAQDCNLPGSTCRWWTEEYSYCVKTDNGCGLWGLRACNGLCHVKDS